MKHHMGRLLVITLLSLATDLQCSHADTIVKQCPIVDYTPPTTQYFVSETHFFLFKIIPPQRITSDHESGAWIGASAGMLYGKDEQELWRTKLINMPRMAYVSNNRQAVITIGNWGQPQDKHAVVVYGAQGEMLADYSPQDLLPSKLLAQLKTAVHCPGSESIASLWLYQAKFSLPYDDLFTIVYRDHSGGVSDIGIDLKTGNASRDGRWLPRKR